MPNVTVLATGDAQSGVRIGEAWNAKIDADVRSSPIVNRFVDGVKQGVPEVEPLGAGDVR